MKTRTSIFSVREGQVAEQGKVYYPDFVTIKLSRYDALDMLARLANGLKCYDEDGMPIKGVDITLAGLVSEYEDEE